MGLHGLRGLVFPAPRSTPAEQAVEDWVITDLHVDLRRLLTQALSSGASADRLISELLATLNTLAGQLLVTRAEWGCSETTIAALRHALECDQRVRFDAAMRAVSAIVRRPRQ